MHCIYHVIYIYAHTHIVIFRVCDEWYAPPNLPPPPLF
jgi:hypothetical protein